MQPAHTPIQTDAVRQKHAVRLAYIIIVVGLVYIGLSLPLFVAFHRHWWLIASHVFDAVALVASLFYLHKTRNSEVVMWAVCAVDIIAIVPYGLDGGVGGIGIQTVTGALLVIFLLKGRAGLLFWLVTAFPAFITFLPLNMMGLLALPYPTAQYGAFLLNEFLALLLLWLYGGEKERLDHELAERTRELEISKASVERKVKERTHELAESQGKLNSTIQSLTTIGLIMIDRQYEILIKNNAIDNVLAYGKSWHFKDFAMQLQDVDLLKECDGVFERGKVAHLDEVQFGIRILRLGLNPVFADGAVIAIVMSVQDITEQKVMERSKDEFFSIASHELRTPLTAIRGNMSMVRDNFPDAMKDELLAGMVEDTHAASTRLIEIVNDFLDSSTLEQGRMVFNIAPVALEPVIKMVVDDLKPLLQTHEDRIEFADLAHAPRVAADEGRLKQILYNLLSNATKYTQDSKITVTAEADKSGRKVEIRVTDTGKGIPIENQRLLFHKFQQAGASTLTRDDTKGTGLGLYIAKLLATKMHGDVVLERSEVDKGSTFLLTLPIADKQ